MTEDDGSTARLWVEYKQSGDRGIRDQLIVLYSPLVKYVAARVAEGRLDPLTAAEVRLLEILSQRLTHLDMASDLHVRSTQ